MGLMKLVIEYDPWHESRVAIGAADWLLESYGITADLRDVPANGRIVSRPNLEAIVARFERSKSDEDDGDPSIKEEAARTC